MGTETTVDIDLHGIPLQIDGYYSRGYMGSLEQPPEPREFEIYSISIVTDEKSHDILELLEEGGYLERIEEQVLEQIQ